MLGLSLKLSLSATKTGFHSQQQPNRSTGEVVETVGFARTIEGHRQAGFGLANRRLQPLSQDRLHKLRGAMTRVVPVSRMSPRRGENRDDSGGRQ